MATSALAIGVTITGPASTARADDGGRWYIVNQYNGKCVQGHGRGKNLTLGTCKKKNAFQWQNYGSHQYVNFSESPGGEWGVLCMAQKGKDKPVSLKPCHDVDGVWQIASLNNGAKTPITNVKCGALQAVNTTTLKCGKVPANRKKMTWIIKYSLS
ncbi:hypothetical protein EJ357_30155 [Streptomyces cyaneochromogenes]|uniref:Ricin B lectin domain-containing protein n=1 Tax=Streptomyces cyaneochromogenes TaxID=2496836 RepID=A0A3Q9ER13_9ACTN|nr:hypothetical protein [Streptomyces cyaneochromogenes]AZQ37186.1 hypothetical protein EJ357_30155 [Streptomyces cyaneochromogenes]